MFKTVTLKITTPKKPAIDISKFEKYYLLSDPLEKLLALTLILLGIMPLTLIYIYIKLCKPGQDLFFIQERFGKDNKPFKIIKFTTMSKKVTDMPTNQLNKFQDCISSTGKFLRRTRINELPQLFNILTGDMKLVGPRPAIAQDKELLAKRDELGLSKLKPGLAFIDRLYDDEKMTLQQRMRFECIYLKDRSTLKRMSLDLWILGQSIKFVLRQFRMRSGLVKFPSLASEKEKQRSLSKAKAA
jgi:O-antigen biosynthesis protein WbqP